MAVHNAEAYLDAAVKSILNQSFTDFEFIIIDDGSTDGSRNKLGEYSRKDNRVRLISRANKGLTPSLNEGLKLARGQYIARMDADDVASPVRLGLQVQYLYDHPQVSLLGGAYELIDDAGRLLTTIVPPTDDATLQEHALGPHADLSPAGDVSARRGTQGGGVRRRILGGAGSGSVAQARRGRQACRGDKCFAQLSSARRIRQREEAGASGSQHAACMRARLRARGITRQFKGDAGWRPTSGRNSRHEYALRYGWWAFNSGQRKTAMIYGFKAIGAMPWNSQGWRLLACAAVKKIPSLPSPSPQ